MLRLTLISTFIGIAIVGGCDCGGPVDGGEGEGEGEGIGEEGEGETGEGEGEGTCSNDDECPDGQACGDGGTCEAAPCASDADCTPLTCDLASGVCVGTACTG